MMLGNLQPGEIVGELRAAGIRLRIGPFHINVRSEDALFASTFGLLYADFPLLATNEPAEFRIELDHPKGIRRWWRPQVRFLLDDSQPFEPFPKSHAMPLFEWGFNWCIYEHIHEFLIMHAAALEWGGRALIMPAPPGSGKSTLCAALTHSGWRLLSDEFALIRKPDSKIVPIPRPIGLKEHSIELIRGIAPSARFGPVFSDTRKGSVAHLKPPTDAVSGAEVVAAPAWLVFPRYEAGTRTTLQPLGKASAFVRASNNCFNYGALRKTGFTLLSAVIDECDCYELRFGDLNQALDQLKPLSENLRRVA